MRHMPGKGFVGMHGECRTRCEKSDGKAGDIR